MHACSHLGVEGELGQPVQAQQRPALRDDGREEVARAQDPRERHAGAVGEREAGHAQCRADAPVGFRVGAASAPLLYPNPNPHPHPHPHPHPNPKVCAAPSRPSGKPGGPMVLCGVVAEMRRDATSEQLDAQCEAEGRPRVKYAQPVRRHGLGCELPERTYGCRVRASARVRATPTPNPNHGCRHEVSAE